MAGHQVICEGLTPRELAFCRSCVDQGDEGHVVLTTAAREAGYSTRGKPATIRRKASEVFNRPHVQAKIKQLMAHKMAAAQHTREYVIGTLMYVVEACVSAGDAQIVAAAGNPDAPVPSAGYYAAATRNLELLGKACGGGMFTDRRITETEPSIPIEQLYANIRKTLAEIRDEHGQSIKIPKFIEAKLKEHAKSAG